LRLLGYPRDMLASFFFRSLPPVVSGKPCNSSRVCYTLFLLFFREAGAPARACTGVSWWAQHSPFFLTTFAAQETRFLHVFLRPVTFIMSLRPSRTGEIQFLPPSLWGFFFLVYLFMFSLILLGAARRPFERAADLLWDLSSRRYSTLPEPVAPVRMEDLFERVLLVSSVLFL